MTGEAPRARHGGALLAQLLADHGVQYVFGVPGGQTLALYDAMADHRPSMRHVLVRDERSGAYAADAYARVTGRVGVCDATVGPGATKLPSGLAEALGASVPVVALVSDLPGRLAQHRYRGAASQALDQAALLAPVTKWLASVTDISSMPALVRQAFREATTGRPGPVALLVAQDVLDQIPGDQPAAVLTAWESRFASFPALRPEADPQDVAATAAALGRASRPFLLVGGGAMHSGASTEVTGLAARLSGAVGTTLTGKGAIAEDHACSVGVVGTMGTSAATAALDEADVVLLVGTKASSGSTFSWSRPRADQIVLQIDIDPVELGRAFPLQAGVLADARSGLRAMLDALGPLGADEPDRAAWRARIDELNSTWRSARAAERGSQAVPIAPQRVMGELERLVGPNDVLVCDASLASGWGGVYFEQRVPGRRVLCPRGQAGLGYALPAAIGVAIADESRRTVVITGDGAIGYAVGELATIAEHRLPVTVVVLNNSSLGWIRWYGRITFGRGYEEPDFAQVAFAEVARGFGWSGERVADPDQLAKALESALATEGPSLVDVVTEVWQTPVAAHRRALEQGTSTTGYGG